MKHILQDLQNKKRFSQSELIKIFTKIVEGSYSDIEISAFLYGLSILGEGVDEILSLVKVLRKKAKIFEVASEAIDVAGTGGDGKSSLNISTTVAFVTSSCGINTIKHGNRAVSSASGSSDVLTALGIDINASEEILKKTLKKSNLCFLFAPNYHKALANIAHIRKFLGVRTIFNLIGPLLNPALVKRQLIGVFSRDILPIYAEVVQQLNYDKVILVSSFDGLDEISVSGETEIYEINKSEKIKNYIIKPEDFGLKRSDIAELKGGDAKYNAKRMEKLFKNPKKDAYYDFILLNSAFALFVSGKFNNIESAFKEAENALNKKLPYDKLREMQNDNI